MRLFTVQHKRVLDILLQNSIYYPEFTSDIADNKYEAYKFVLDYYNELTNANFSGLLFAICEENGKLLETYEDYVLAIREFRGGVGFAGDDYYLLELEVPANMELLPIDYYMFSDLIYFTSEEQLDNVDFKTWFYKPTLENIGYELCQTHLPYLEPSMIQNIRVSEGWIDWQTWGVGDGTDLLYYKSQLVKQ